MQHAKEDQPSSWGVLAAIEDTGAPTTTTTFVNDALRLAKPSHPDQPPLRPAGGQGWWPPPHSGTSADREKGRVQHRPRPSMQPRELVPRKQVRAVTCRKERRWDLKPHLFCLPSLALPPIPCQLPLMGATEAQQGLP